jgi:hypothetical protein
MLLGPLKTFAKESRSNKRYPIIMEDNIPMYKDACVKPRKGLKWPSYEHPPNSPDLNPIENIWVYMKYQVILKYRFMSSQAEMRRLVLEIWNNFMDSQWDGLIASI